MHCRSMILIGYENVNQGGARDGCVREPRKLGGKYGEECEGIVYIIYIQELLDLRYIMEYNLVIRRFSLR